MQKYVYATTFKYPAEVNDDPRYKCLSKLLKQLGNIKAERSSAGYNKYTMLNTILGDDLVDSCIASVWAQEEIKTLVFPAGGHVPQMEFSDRHKFKRIGADFLHDRRNYAPQSDQSIYTFLDQDG
tara:strand:- start:334 stop:708 length:375 start_codon:yes stop_codon:yes gene_type:complete